MAAPKLAKVSERMLRPTSWNMEYDESAEFPVADIGLGLTVQLVWVTPEIANEWLGLRAKQQRPIKAQHLQSIISDISQDRFLLNGQPIIFDWNGYMIDGQHRCTAIVSSGKSGLVLVVRGLSPDAYVTLDNTSKRSGSDVLRMKDYKDSKLLAAAVRLFGIYQRGQIGKTQIVFSPPAIDELLLKNPGIVESVMETRNANELGSKATLAFCHYVFNSIDPDATREFFRHLQDGANLEKGNAILALRTRLFRMRIPSTEMIFLIFKAWNAWREDKHVMLIRYSTKEDLPTPH